MMLLKLNKKPCVPGSSFHTNNRGFKSGGWCHLDYEFFQPLSFSNEVFIFSCVLWGFKGSGVFHQGAKREVHVDCIFTPSFSETSLSVSMGWTLDRALRETRKEQKAQLAKACLWGRLHFPTT